MVAWTILVKMKMEDYKEMFESIEPSDGFNMEREGGEISKLMTWFLEF